MDEDDVSRLAHNAKGMICNIINAIDIIEMEDLKRVPDVIQEMMDEIRIAANDVIECITQLRDVKLALKDAAAKAT